jgi:hypothetical protein
MPLVTCPGCYRKIELPFQELTWTIQCKVCGSTFVPVGIPPLRAQLNTPIDELPDLAAHQPRARRSLLVVLSLIAGGLGLIVLISGLALMSNSQESNQGLVDKLNRHGFHFQRYAFLSASGEAEDKRLRDTGWLLDKDNPRASVIRPILQAGGEPGDSAASGSGLLFYAKWRSAQAAKDNVARVTHSSECVEGIWVLPLDKDTVYAWEGFCFYGDPLLIARLKVTLR